MKAILTWARVLTGVGQVDQALSRILLQRFRVGAFDPKDRVSFRKIPIDVLDSGPHRALALQAAREAITLLGNVDHALPLVKKPATKIGVVGPMADNTAVMAGGKSDYHPSFTVSVLDGIQSMVRAFGGAEVRYAQGSATSGNSSDPELLQPALQVAGSVDVLIVCVGIDSKIEHEGTDRTFIGLPPTQLEMLQAVTAAARKNGAKVIAVLVNGGPLSIDWLKSALDATPPTVHAAIEAYDLGQSAGQVVAEVLWGDTNPSGSLPFTLFPEDYVNQVSLTNMSMRPGGHNPVRPASVAFASQPCACSQPHLEVVLLP